MFQRVYFLDSAMHRQFSEVQWSWRHLNLWKSLLFKIMTLICSLEGICPVSSPGSSQLFVLLTCLCQFIFTLFFRNGIISLVPISEMSSLFLPFCCTEDICFYQQISCNSFSSLMNLSNSYLMTSFL